MGGCIRPVRDRLLGPLSRAGVKVKVLTPDEHGEALRWKLVEEAIEYALTGSLEEAGDVIEALVSILNMQGYTLTEALEAAARKRNHKGGFYDAIGVNECAMRRGLLERYRNASGGELLSALLRVLPEWLLIKLLVLADERSTPIKPRKD